MDLLVEKGNNKTYLSQLGFLVTSFEEGAPAIARNSTNIQGRNGSVDFGGWHESKKVKLEGFYRAEDQYEEETLKERLFALLSDPEGIYITEMRGEIGQGFERPGETEGEVYEHMMTRPGHKRFYVYASSIENEFQGNVGGTVLYKMSVEFTTLKLPYGESVPRDLDVKHNVPYYGRNLFRGYPTNSKMRVNKNNTYYYEYPFIQLGTRILLKPNTEYTLAWDYAIISGGMDSTETVSVGRGNEQSNYAIDVKTVAISTKKITIKTPSDISDYPYFAIQFSRTVVPTTSVIDYWDISIREGNINSGWSPAPEDPEYNQWYLNTYYNTDNLVIPYAGTVPCSQLEQGFSIEFTAKESGSNFKLNVNGTELTYNGQVYNGDVLKLSGYEYTKNGLSVVRSTNKAYFKLLPNVANTLSASLHGTIKVLNFQNLYA